MEHERRENEESLYLFEDNTTAVSSFRYMYDYHFKKHLYLWPFPQIVLQIVEQFFCSVVHMQMIINSKFPFLDNNNEHVQFSHITI